MVDINGQMIIDGAIIRAENGNEFVAESALVLRDTKTAGCSLLTDYSVRLYGLKVIGYMDTLDGLEDK